jgi:GntR family transcriptional regulator
VVGAPVKLTLAQASGVPFWRQLHDQLADHIRAGALVPGAALPSVRQLAADTLVSVITVKKAYDELEAAGLVASHQGRGTFVAEGAARASRQVLLDALTEDLATVVERGRRAGVFDDELEALWRRARGGAGGG